MILPLHITAGMRFPVSPFYKVAQAISETLPNESKEKKLLDGFLSGKDKLMSEIKEKSIKKELF